MKSKLFVMLLFALPFLSIAQDRVVRKGMVVSDATGVEDALVVNYTAQLETRTDFAGNFSIKAQTGDLLIISDYKIEEKRIRFTPDIVNDGLAIINVRMAVTELEEIIVYKNNNLTSEALGLVPKGQRRYTPAERRLKTASDMTPTFFVGTMAGIAVPTDPIINAITGRTKMLRKELQVEKKERVLEALSGMYTEEEIAAEFAIPEPYTDGFLYFIADEPGFTNKFIKNNAGLVKVEMTRLAAEYLQRIKNEE
ncbi:MAG: hypothetical protein EOO45_11875 [Flavobacterium sp.]|nr:MAG: hypothetical protein EOO45_11875 [Flavobacterium sp.]